jgi:hypothetical protein
LRGGEIRLVFPVSRLILSRAVHDDDLGGWYQRDEEKEVSRVGGKRETIRSMKGARCP